MFDRPPTRDLSISAHGGEIGGSPLTKMIPSGSGPEGIVCARSGSNRGPAD